MNKKYFNAKYEESSNFLSEITKLKKDIVSLKSEISIKKDVMNNAYLNKINLSSKKEKRIKALMDNRHFRFMKMIDFISEEDIETKQGFAINKDSGFVVPEVIKSPEVKLFNKMINPSNPKEIIFEFENTVYSNLMSFSFKDKDSLPLTPKNIKIEYNGNSEDFFEPNFRYYNRNATNVFVNNFFFYPKKILKVFVTFSGDYDFNSAKCNLYSCSFNISKDSFMDISIKNTGKIENFNIFKNSDETNVPFVFEYTEDNSLYKPIEFEKQEAVVSLDNSSDFKIRVRNDYENVEQKEFTEIKKTSISIKEMSVVNNARCFDMVGKITNFDIAITQGSYKKMRDKFIEVFDESLNIDKFISNENGVFKVRKEFISIVNEPSDDILNMILQDDISELKENESIFNFYVDEKDKNIYFSSFMLEYSFFLQLENEIVVDSIPNDMLTPYLFDLQIKG
ncbi:MAG: hypothetical protein ACRCZ2_00350 [Fusobacteriaceae bacterium]